jgi:hypothetical protein
MKDVTPGRSRVAECTGCTAVPAEVRHAVGPKKIRRAGFASSTASADLPLPGTAFGSGFVLLALRARRKQHTNALAERSRGPESSCAQFAHFSFSKRAQRFVQRELEREIYGSARLKSGTACQSNRTKKIRRAGFAFVPRLR